MTSPYLWTIYRLVAVLTGRLLNVVVRLDRGPQPSPGAAHGGQVGAGRVRAMDGVKST